MITEFVANDEDKSLDNNEYAFAHIDLIVPSRKDISIRQCLIETPSKSRRRKWLCHEQWMMIKIK